MNAYQKIIADATGESFSLADFERYGEEATAEAQAYLEANFPGMEFSTTHTPIRDLLFVRDAQSRCLQCPGLAKCNLSGYIPKLARDCYGGLSVVRGVCEERQKFEWTCEVQKYLGESEIPHRLLQCGFKNYRTDLHPDCEKMRNGAVEAWRRGSSLVLASVECGNGKTHLAAAVLNAALREGKGKRGLFVSVPDFIDKVRQEMQKRDEAPQVPYRLFREADVLVLDDLGKEAGSAFVQEKLYTLINARYLNDLQTIITTNIPTPEALIKSMGKHGEAIVSRLQEMCGPGGWIVSEAPDYRPQKGAESIRRAG